jgi:hypothetical protein
VNETASDLRRPQQGAPPRRDRDARTEARQDNVPAPICELLPGSPREPARMNNASVLSSHPASLEGITFPPAAAVPDAAGVSSGRASRYFPGSAASGTVIAGGVKMVKPAGNLVLVRDLPDGYPGVRERSRRGQDCEPAIAGTLEGPAATPGTGPAARPRCPLSRIAMSAGRCPAGPAMVRPGLTGAGARLPPQACRTAASPWPPGRRRSRCPARSTPGLCASAPSASRDSVTRLADLERLSRRQRGPAPCRAPWLPWAIGQ